MPMPCPIPCAQYRSLSQITVIVKYDFWYSARAPPRHVPRAASSLCFVLRVWRFHCGQISYPVDQGRSLTACLQRWAKEWALGCVNSPPAARGSQEAGFTQPRAHSFAQPCTAAKRNVSLFPRSHHTWDFRSEGPWKFVDFFLCSARPEKLSGKKPNSRTSRVSTRIQSLALTSRRLWVSARLET